MNECILASLAVCVFYILITAHVIEWFLSDIVDGTKENIVALK